MPIRRAQVPLELDRAAVSDLFGAPDAVYVSNPGISKIEFAADSPLEGWREMDSNFWFLPVWSGLKHDVSERFAARKTIELAATAPTIIFDQVA
jgi:hypothetical protein